MPGQRHYRGRRGDRRNPVPLIPGFHRPYRPSEILPRPPSIAGRSFVWRVGSKKSEHSIIPGMSFRRRPESSVNYPSTRERHLGSGFRRSDEYSAAGPIDAFDTGSWKLLFDGSQTCPLAGNSYWKLTMDLD